MICPFCNEECHIIKIFDKHFIQPNRNFKENVSYYGVIVWDSILLAGLFLFGQYCISAFLSKIVQ